MKPSLDLKYHFYSSVHVVADVDIIKEAKPDSEFGYNFTTEVEVGKSENNQFEFQVKLTIKSEPAEGKLKGYDIELTIVGFVEADSSYPEDRRDGMVSVVGASILYGAARDFLLTLTSRGPYPPVYLPTVSFIPDNDGNERPDKTSIIEE